jgi:hypothetical protein
LPRSARSFRADLPARIDYVSCSPYRLSIARGAVAQAAQAAQAALARACADTHMDAHDALEVGS